MGPIGAKPSHNTSGVKGVSWNKKSGKWAAYICAGRKRTHLGLFDALGAASAARRAAAEEAFGDFTHMSEP